MQEILELILKGMQRKYRGLLELERLTKELADLLGAGDRDSVQIVLKMRQSVIEEAHEEDAALRELLGALDREDYLHVSGLMNGNKENISSLSFEEEKIVQLAGQTKNVLDKLIAVDKRISLKLAGKDSYYQ